MDLKTSKVTHGISIGFSHNILFISTSCRKVFTIRITYCLWILKSGNDEWIIGTNFYEVLGILSNSSKFLIISKRVGEQRLIILFQRVNNVWLCFKWVNSFWFCFKRWVSTWFCFNGWISVWILFQLLLVNSMSNLITRKMITVASFISTPRKHSINSIPRDCHRTKLQVARNRCLAAL